MIFWFLFVCFFGQYPPQYLKIINRSVDKNAERKNWRKMAKTAVAINAGGQIDFTPMFADFFPLRTKGEVIKRNSLMLVEEDGEKSYNNWLVHFYSLLQYYSSRSFYYFLRKLPHPWQLEKKILWIMSFNHASCDVRARVWSRKAMRQKSLRLV